MEQETLKRLRGNRLLALAGGLMTAGMVMLSPFIAGCENSKKETTGPATQAAPHVSIKTCKKKSSITVFPHTGRVLTEEYCADVNYTVETMTQWDFGNLQQVCSGLGRNNYGGPAMALGGCKSIFDASVHAGEREYLLDTLNIERKKIGLPDLVPEKPSP